MKIVFLSTAAQGGGAEEALFDLVNGLKKTEPGWQLHFICGEQGPLCERVRHLGAEVEIISFPASFRTYGEQSRDASGQENRFHRAKKSLRAGICFAGYLWKLRRRLRQLNPDILHSHGLKMHLAAALVRSRRAIVVWHLQDYISTRALTSRLLPRLSFRVPLVLACSRSVAEDAQKILPSTRVEVVENAVDLARFRPEGPALDLDRLSGLPSVAPGTVKVGMVGTFARWKGQDLFLRAIALLPADLSARFYVVGGPVYATPGSQWTKEELAQTAAPFADRVGFTGWVDDAAAAIRALDVVVHASTKPEPFGLVIIQAQACGKPVIVSGEGGAKEIAANLPGAVTFTPRDAQNLADVMRSLIVHAERRATAGKNGPVAVRERFASERMTATAINYFKKIEPHAALRPPPGDPRG